MTEHDRVRMERALACNRDDLESVSDAVRGLQSTDDPNLLPLHDALMARLRQLRDAQSVPVAALHAQLANLFGDLDVCDQLGLGNLLLEHEQIESLIGETNAVGWWVEQVDVGSITSRYDPPTHGRRFELAIEFSLSGEQEDEKMMAGDAIRGTATLHIWPDRYELKDVAAHNALDDEDAAQAAHDAMLEDMEPDPEDQEGPED